MRHMYHNDVIAHSEKRVSEVAATPRKLVMVSQSAKSRWKVLQVSSNHTNLTMPQGVSDHVEVYRTSVTEYFPTNGNDSHDEGRKDILTSKAPAWRGVEPQEKGLAENLERKHA